MATELDELIDFLSSPSTHVKKVAVDIVRGLTGSDDGIEAIGTRAEKSLPSLVALLRDPGADVIVSAVEALINLSQDPTIAEKLVCLGTIGTVMDVLYKQTESKISRLLVMLLANLTQSESGSNSLLQVGNDKMEGLYIAKLVRSFCKPSSREIEEDTFEHVSSILINISKVEAGRRMLLEPKRGLLKQIVCQFDSANSQRKMGILGTIKNCCFEADTQLQNLLLISEFLWPALLLPVAGKKVYAEQDISKMPLELGNALSHERETVDDPELRTQALEAIYLISLQETGRRALWSVNGPRILQVGYEDEEDPKAMEAYELIGSLLVTNAETEEPANEKTSNT